MVYKTMESHAQFYGSDYPLSLIYTYHHRTAQMFFKANFQVLGKGNTSGYYNTVRPCRSSTKYRVQSAINDITLVSLH